MLLQDYIYYLNTNPISEKLSLFLTAKQRLALHIRSRGLIPIPEHVILAYLRKTPAMWFISLVVAYQSSGVIKPHMSYRISDAYQYFLRRDWVSLLSWYLSWEREAKLTDDYFLKRSPLGLFMEYKLFGTLQSSVRRTVLIHYMNELGVTTVCMSNVLNESNFVRTLAESVPGVKLLLSNKVHSNRYQELVGTLWETSLELVVGCSDTVDTLRGNIPAIIINVNDSSAPFPWSNSTDWVKQNLM